MSKQNIHVGADRNVKGDRMSVISARTINLVQTNPLKRLRELCKQGKYSYKFKWDKFNNGMMMKCELYYNKKNRKYITCQETQFIFTTNVSEAQEIISAVLLHSIGLGVEEDASPAPEESTRMGVKDMGMKAFGELFDVISKSANPSAPQTDERPTSEMSPSEELRQMGMNAVSGLFEVVIKNAEEAVPQNEAYTSILKTVIGGAASGKSWGEMSSGGDDDIQDD